MEETIYKRIINKYIPKDKVQEIISKAKKTTDLTEEERAYQEADVFNKLVGKLTDYDCPICKNKGIIYNPVNKPDAFGTLHWEVVSSTCNCMKIRNEIKRINKSGLSRLISKNTFKNYITKYDWQNEIKSLSIRYSNDPKGWFYIGGQPGSGKTHICTAITSQIIKSGKSARYMLWSDDITTLKQVINDYDLYKKLIENYKNAEVLYIDNFFKTRNKEQISTADVNASFKIINYRYNENLPTIISSELSLHEITDIDEALGSRIIEMCGDNAIYIKPDLFKNYRYKKG